MRKISKSEKIVNNQTLVVTVDVSKDKNTGYFRCPDGREVKPFTFGNHREGFSYFYDRLCWMKRRHRLLRVVVGFESTGCYAEPLSHFLRNEGVDLVQVNTAHTKRVKELYDNSPGKTDQKDPKVIADLIELGRVLQVVIPVGVSAALRRLIHARDRCLQTKGSLLNQLHDLVFLIFPEFGQIIKNLQSKTAHYLLSCYTTPEEIVKLGMKELESELRRISRGRVSGESARHLFEAARHSVGIREGQSCIVKEIQNLLQAVVQQQHFVEAYESEISGKLSEIPWSIYLLSMKGIGEITVGAVIGEVGDFKNFRTSLEVEKYAGLNLFEISSGKHKGRRRISKRGRSLLRKMLYFASLNMVRKDGIFRDTYQSYLDRGTPKPKALVAISRKLLRVMFAIVRDQTEFDLNYLTTNRLSEAA
jgi:transposase